MNSENVSQALNDFMSSIVARLATQITTNLVETTPVDTGFAQVNWIPTINEPFEGTSGTPESS